jgi:hypothetical protein
MKSKAARSRVPVGIGVRIVGPSSFNVIYWSEVKYV